MSKFCGNCGFTMDDAAVVCGNCGAPLAPVAAPAQKKAAKFDVSAITGSLKGIVDGVKKGDKSALLKCGIAGGILVVVIVLIIALCSTPGEEKVAKKFIKAFDKENPEAIVKLLPKFSFGDVEEGDDEMDEGDWADEFEDSIEYFNEGMDKEYGFDEYSIKYELLYTQDYGKDYLKDIEEEYEEYEEFEDKKLKGATDLVYRVVFKGKGEKVVGFLKVTAVKYGSKWYLNSYSFSRSSVENDEKPDYNYGY